MAKSVECSEIPEKSGIIRVDDYKQSCVLTTDGKVGSKGNPPHDTHPSYGENIDVVITTGSKGYTTHTHTKNPLYIVNREIVTTTGYKNIHTTHLS